MLQCSALAICDVQWAAVLIAMLNGLAGSFGGRERDNQHIMCT